jgi:molybdopterin-biosynthesis enzyme MoeA-like protein
MRLTVHVTDAKKETVIKKNADGQEKKIVRVISTLSFSGVEESDLQTILNSIQEGKQGTPVKYYFSNERTPGLARVGKKKQQ